jgi:hypothetical protein
MGNDKVWCFRFLSNVEVGGCRVSHYGSHRGRDLPLSTVYAWAIKECLPKGAVIRVWLQLEDGSDMFLLGLPFRGINPFV